MAKEQPFGLLTHGYIRVLGGTLSPNVCSGPTGNEVDNAPRLVSRLHMVYELFCGQYYVDVWVER